MGIPHLLAKNSSASYTRWYIESLSTSLRKNVYIGWDRFSSHNTSSPWFSGNERGKSARSSAVDHRQRLGRRLVRQVPWDQILHRIPRTQCTSPESEYHTSTADRWTRSTKRRSSLSILPTRGTSDESLLPANTRPWAAVYHQDEAHWSFNEACTCGEGISAILPKGVMKKALLVMLACHDAPPASSYTLQEAKAADF